MPEPFSVAAIRWGSIPPLLLISLAVMGSPGPATISLVAVGSVFGVRHSLKYLIGIIVGTTVVLVAVGTGFTIAFVALPAIGSVLLGSRRRSTPRCRQPEEPSRDLRWAQRSHGPIVCGAQFHRDWIK